MSFQMDNNTLAAIVAIAIAAAIVLTRFASRPKASRDVEADIATHLAETRTVRAELRQLVDDLKAERGDR